MIDTHTHLADPAFDRDREAVLASLIDSGITAIIEASWSKKSLDRVQEICQNRGVSAAFGIHPSYIEEIEEKDRKKLEYLVTQNCCVAVGEIGLDYTSKDADRKKQQTWFACQLALAKSHGLPVIVHSRKALEDTVRLIDRFPELRGVIHGYGYGEGQVMTFIRRGWYLGIGQVLLLPESRKLLEAVKASPLTSLLLETDAPYGKKGERTEPSKIWQIAKRVADIKEESVETVVGCCDENAGRLFKSLQGRHLGNELLVRQKEGENT